MAQSTNVTTPVLRPRKTRKVCWGLAAFIVVLFTSVSFVLTGSTGDQAPEGPGGQLGETQWDPDATRVLVGVISLSGLFAWRCRS